MNLYEATKQKTKGKKYPQLTRVKIGKAIMVWAAIPCNFSIWMAPVGAIMAFPLSPTMWAKDKIRHYRQGRQFK